MAAALNSAMRAFTTPTLGVALLAMACVSVATAAPLWFTVMGDLAEPAADTVELNVAELSFRGEKKAMDLRVNLAAQRTMASGEKYQSYVYQAFEHLQVNRALFVELAHACAGEVGDQLRDCSWLRENHLMSINERLDAVLDAQTRRLVCGLGLAAITADGQLTDDERLVYDHALARWHLSRDDVARTGLPE